jgi:hypothetical protein
MTSLIEVELPRYTITSLDRSDEDYWKVNGHPEREGEHHRLLARPESTLSMVEEGRVQGFLRGGSWRAFHWRKLIVGRKLYRIQYEDELREPPAEIDFSELVHFLLDWGAVPDSKGWEKLKSGGLWTPAGTVLLTTPEDQGQKHMDWVLRTSMPEDSDGILSLTIKWSSDAACVAESRGAASLPPGWGRLCQPPLLGTSEKTKVDNKDLSSRIEDLKMATTDSATTSSFRFHAESNCVRRLMWEHENVETGFVAEPFTTNTQSTGSQWFSSAASSLLSMTQSSGGLWAFEIPSEIRLFVRKESVPCGVMVILGLLDETAAPQWSSEQDRGAQSESLNMAKYWGERHQIKRAAEQLEAKMPPEQARVHRANRQMAELREQSEHMMANLAAQRKREEQKVTDAISSPKMSIKAVAEACLAWLIEQGEIGREWTMPQLAEAVLYLLVVDQSQSEQSEAKRIAQVLEEWQSWAIAGGMRRQQVQMLGDNKLAFCFAAALVAVIHESDASNSGLAKSNADMLECLRLWRKVRLG